jgi:hypothetical protein
MSCPYFKEGYFGVCVAFESMYIARMETYCFKEDYRLCPGLASYTTLNLRGKGLSERYEDRYLRETT